MTRSDPRSKRTSGEGTVAAVASLACRSVSDPWTHLMFDIDLFKQLNLILGGRYDTSDAENTDFASFNASLVCFSNSSFKVAGM